MKTKLLFYLMLLIGLNFSAQATTILDPNFEQALINLGYDTGSPDGFVPTANISSITSLNVGGMAISDLTGIQDFSSLVILWCHDNQIANLNLSGMSNLIYLYCFNNQMVGLNLSGLNSLQQLSCNNNQITALNVNGLNNLVYLDCNSNQIASLNAGGLTNLFALRCFNNQLNSLTVTGSNSLTNIDCSNNLLTSLDVSGLNNLDTLSCMENDLTCLSVSGLPRLASLVCSFNQLTKLDLTNAPVLATVRCQQNPNLTCIKVNNVSAATANTNWIKDNTAAYALNCTACAIPCTVLDIPLFIPIDPICSGGILIPPPNTSLNGIPGVWSPAFNNTVTTTYTFTPDAGYCASIRTLTITVNPLITPTFTQIAPVCLGALLPPLPTTSLNGIAGTWSPTLSNIATTTYTFTPNAGQCATNTAMTLVVNPIVTPTFTAIAPVCTLTTTSPLPTTSTNGITGTWSPAFDNTTPPFNFTITVYTFTPDAGQCASSTTMSITVLPVESVFFIPIDPICSGAALIPPPNTSMNGITGTWSPAFNNTITTTYTFTPDAGYCALPRTLTIVVNPSGTPTFTQVAPVCSTTVVSPLLTTSNNGIAGTWSPAFNNSATTLYTFTPTASQCATTTTMTIAVTTATLWYLDSDNDAYGNPLISISACAQPIGYVSNSTDCNDSNADINPNHVEVPGNGLDDNCSGTIDEVLPTVQVIPSQCGITLTSLWDTIFATQLPATNYRFEISAGSFVRTYDTSLPLSQLYKCTMYNFPCVAFNTTYAVRVARKVNGFWQAYGPSCNITTPIGITTSLVPSSCGTTVSSSWNTFFINPVGSILPCFAVTGYRVKVVDQNGLTSYLTLTVPGPTGFNLRGGFVPPVQRAPNATYTISIEVALNGAWQTPGGVDLYGPTCVIRTSPTYSRESESASNTIAFKAIAYPNPYTDNFNLDITSEVEHGLEVKIYDMMGRLIESHQLAAADMSAMEFGKHYASGVYNVIVTQDEQTKTLRVIKR